MRSALLAYSNCKRICGAKRRCRSKLHNTNSETIERLNSEKIMEYLLHLFIHSFVRWTTAARWHVVVIPIFIFVFQWFVRATHLSLRRFLCILWSTPTRYAFISHIISFKFIFFPSSSSQLNVYWKEEFPRVACDRSTRCKSEKNERSAHFIFTRFAGLCAKVSQAHLAYPKCHIEKCKKRNWKKWAETKTDAEKSIHKSLSWWLMYLHEYAECGRRFFIARESVLLLLQSAQSLYPFWRMKMNFYMN